eukprot:443564-Prymnesium_polylepis.2
MLRSATRSFTRSASLRRHLSTRAAALPDIKICYFPTQGRAEAMRMILEYGAIPYTDCSVADYFGERWRYGAKERAPLGTLPIMDIDGDVIAQSGAMVRFAASLVPGLVPDDPLARARCEMICEAGAELTVKDSNRNVNALVNVYKGDEFDEMKATFMAWAPGFLPHLARQIPRNGDGPFFFGDKPLFCDFVVYAALDNTRLVEPALVEEHASLRDFMRAFEALPGVAEYLAARPKLVGIGSAPQLEPKCAGLRSRGYARAMQGAMGEAIVEAMPMGVARS